MMYKLINLDSKFIMSVEVPRQSMKRFEPTIPQVTPIVKRDCSADAREPN